MIRARARGWSDAEMPVARYFLFVGGVLLALLFVFDAYAPKLPVVSSAAVVDATAEKPTLRIRSDRKWPEAVVFDTSQPTIVAALAANAQAPTAASPVAEISAKARVRESFAQFVLPEPKKPEPKPQPKRRIAKVRVAPPMMLVAQQPRFGLFGNNTW
jgi:hypothetical protein